MKNALTFPDVDACSTMFCLFLKLGLDMLSAIILAIVGTQSPFCRACKTHDVLLARMDLKTVH